MVVEIVLRNASNVNIKDNQWSSASLKPLIVKDKLSDSDNDIATTVLRVSLTCPLGKMRMATPCRASTCSHLQCFDASVFLSMNEKRPTWMCPVCNKPAAYDNLVIDGYFQDVLASPSLGDSCNEIQLNKDGSWSTHNANDALTTCSLTPSKNEKTLSVDSPKPEIQEINDDDDDEPTTVTPAPHSETNGETRVIASNDKTDQGKEKEKEMVVVDLTCSDSEDEAPPPPPAAAPKEAIPPPAAAPPPIPQNHAFSDSSSNLSATRSSPSIINLDSPSPSPPLSNYNNLSAPGAVSPPSSYMCHMRLAPDSRYHPY